MKEKNDIGNLPGYSKLGKDWKDKIISTVAKGFRTREDYYSFIVDLQGVSLGRVPENINHLLMSEDFYQAMYHQLTGTSEANIEARKLLIRRIIEKTVPDTFQFFSSRAQEVQNNGHNYVEAEE